MGSLTLKYLTAFLSLDEEPEKKKSGASRILGNHRLEGAIFEEMKTIHEQTESAPKICALRKRLRNIGKTFKYFRVVGNIDNDDDDSDEEESDDSSLDISVEPPEERKCFRVLIDTTNFDTGLDVKVFGKYLLIHGKHGMASDEHGLISREFTRKFEIPDDVDIETFRALIDCYGVLTVEASFQPMKVKERTLDVLAETYDLTNLRRLDGQKLEDWMKIQIKDGLEIERITRELSKHRPAKYIPLEVVNM